MLDITIHGPRLNDIFHWPANGDQLTFHFILESGEHFNLTIFSLPNVADLVQAFQFLKLPITIDTNPVPAPTHTTQKAPTND
ncbi:MAG: hypothetical protein ACREJW_00100 [Candidatus Methylomirabilales bacterium]